MSYARDPFDTDDGPEPYVCPGCAAGLGDILSGCWHTANEWALAEAMRDAVERLHPDADGWEHGSIEGAYNFIQDAEGLPHDVGEPPYSVVMAHPNGGNYVAVGIINGNHLFGIPNDEGDSYSEYLGDLGGLLEAVSTSTETEESWDCYNGKHGYCKACSCACHKETNDVKMLREVDE